MKKRPKKLIFVGTAGSYGQAKIFDILQSASACNIENSFLTGDSYSPTLNKVTFADDVSRETIVNSSSYITTSNTLAKQYLEAGIDLENMEFYAVLQVAKNFNILAEGLFIVTNYCNTDAHRNFVDNHKEAMQKIEKYIKRDIDE